MDRDRRPPIIIKFFQEDGSKEQSEYNLISLMRGLYTLIDQYLDHNGYPPQDTDEVNGRLQTLPLPPPRQGGRDPTNIYFIDILLMGNLENPRTANNAPIIRIPLSNDLYVTYVEIINPPGSEPRRVNFPFDGIDYPMFFENQMSVLTRHLYHGLNELEDQVRDRQEHEYPNDVKITLFCCVVLIAEAARSEYVRAYIVQRNTVAFGDGNAGKMPDNAWTHFRPLLDWTRRAEAAQNNTEDALEQADREHLISIFGSYGQLFAYLARLRYLKKARKIKGMSATNACKEYRFFDNKRKDDDDEEKYPDFKKLDKEINNATSSLQKYEQAYDPANPNEKLASAPNEKRRNIDAEGIILLAEIDERQQLFEVMTGKREETEDYKRKIKDNYSVDLNDEDMQEIAKAYRTEMQDSIFNQLKIYASEGIKTNSVIRRIAIYGSKYLVNIINKIWPKLVEKLLIKLGSKTAGKVIAKKVPILAVGFGVIFGIGRAIKGDWEGAAYEVASGAAGAIPVVGSGVSSGIDAGIAYRDYNTVKKRTEDLANSYSTAVVTICSQITEKETKLTNLMIENEVEEMLEWKAHPELRFLKTYD